MQEDLDILITPNNSVDAIPLSPIYEEEVMDQSQEKDFFWVYIALITILLVGAILMVKMSENDKYDPIIAQQKEEMARMNIRVLK